MNALKHGLSVPITGSQLSNRVACDLAYAIAGDDASKPMLDEARIIAECELSLQRIQHVQVNAIENGLRESRAVHSSVLAAFDKLSAALPIVYSTDRYERRAYSRRKKALQKLNDLQLMAQLRRELGSE
jgi:hypothetical protein